MGFTQSRSVPGDVLLCCCAEDPGEPGWLPPDPGALSMEGMKLVAWGSQSVAQNRWRCPIPAGLGVPISC